MADVSLLEGELAPASTALHCSNPSLVQQKGRAKPASTRVRVNWGLVAALAGNLLFWVGLFLLL